MSTILPPGHSVLWYEIEDVLGQGGFGVTYRARDPNLDQTVAIKEYFPSMFAHRAPDATVLPNEANREDFAWGLARFIDEGRTLARFDDPGIVRVHSVFEEQGTAYLVMRFEAGEPMDALLKRECTLPEVRIRQILDDVMAGLEKIHDTGFIHRDIKPANIYLREDGSAVLIDFGSARQALGVQTQTLTTLVSPGYAPFEQYYSDSNQQGPWTDIYALGATAFRAMTGRAPMPAVDRSKALLHDGSDFVHEALRELTEEYSETFRRAVARATAFREKERPQSIAAWRAMLEGREPVEAEAATIRAGAADAAVAASGDTASAPLDEEATEVLPRTEAVAPTETYAATEVLSPMGAQAPAAAASVEATVQAPTGDESAAAAAAARAGAGRNKWLAGAAVVLVAGIALGALWPRPESDAPQTATSAPEPVAEALTPAEPAVPETTVAAAPPAPAAAAPTVDERAATIRRLLDAALRDLRNDRLVRPRGDNAYEKYRDVQRLEPDNWEAERGLERIVERKVQLADHAADSGDLTRARVHLDEATTVDPGHPAIADARARLARASTSSPTLSERLIDGAGKLNDEKNRRAVRQAKKAFEKRDLSKALDLLDRLGKD